MDWFRLGYSVCLCSSFVNEGIDCKIAVLQNLCKHNVPVARFKSRFRISGDNTPLTQRELIGTFLIDWTIADIPMLAGFRLGDDMMLSL